jgi:hypothetical protein
MTACQKVKWRDLLSMTMIGVSLLLHQPAFH